MAFQNTGTMHNLIWLEHTSRELSLYPSLQSNHVESLVICQDQRCLRRESPTVFVIMYSVCPLGNAWHVLSKSHYRLRTRTWCTGERGGGLYYINIGGRILMQLYHVVSVPKLPWLFCSLELDIYWNDHKHVIYCINGVLCQFGIFMSGLIITCTLWWALSFYMGNLFNIYWEKYPSMHQSIGMFAKCQNISAYHCRGAV